MANADVGEGAGGEGRGRGARRGCRDRDTRLRWKNYVSQLEIKRGRKMASRHNHQYGSQDTHEKESRNVPATVDVEIEVRSSMVCG
jgi:hypothetical protein